MVTNGENGKMEYLMGIHRKVSRKLLWFVGAGLLVLGVRSAAAQVAARQGQAPPPPEVVHFASPMILEMALPKLGEAEPGTPLPFPSTSKYTCDDDVRLLNLSVAKQYVGYKKTRALQIVVAGTVFVKESYDRRADVLARIKKGDEVLGSQRVRNLEAEELRNNQFKIIMPIVEDKLLAAFQTEPYPTLEITLTVRDDS